MPWNSSFVSEISLYRYIVVSKYYCYVHVELSVDGVDVKEAAFRGRKLLGSTLHLPEGFSGFSLTKRSRRTFTLTIIINKFTYMYPRN